MGKPEIGQKRDFYEVVETGDSRYRYQVTFRSNTNTRLDACKVLLRTWMQTEEGLKGIIEVWEAKGFVPREQNEEVKRRWKEAVERNKIERAIPKPPKPPKPKKPRWKPKERTGPPSKASLIPRRVEDVEFGNRVRATRRALGLRQRDIGEMFGIARDQISRLESGLPMGRGSMAFKIRLEKLRIWAYMNKDKRQPFYDKLKARGLPRAGWKGRKLLKRAREDERNARTNTE